MADDLLKFDFGFTAVDESELEAVQEISTKASSTEAEVKELEDKLNKLYIISYAFITEKILQ